MIAKLKNKIAKFFRTIINEGLISALKKTRSFVVRYLKQSAPKQRSKFAKNRRALSAQLDMILSNKDYDRVIIWRSSFGWTVSLFQRPQQIARCLTDKRCLFLYEVTQMTDNVDFISKKESNLYLINYENPKFENLLFEKLKTLSAPKYLQLYSTSGDLNIETVDKYVNNGFKLLYEYIDDLNPVFAGTEDIPHNVSALHNYVINRTDVYVVASADELYNDMAKKRGSEKNLILSTNGVDYDHFANAETKVIPEMEAFKGSYKMIIGYYGAVASWFDYNSVKALAKKYPDIAFVLIGVRYDTTLAASGIEDLENIKYLGARDYFELPHYAKYFDIAWIPFVINEITLATNPIKVFEYMALDKFIITSDMPECRKYKSVNIAKTLDEYSYYIDNYQQLKTETYNELLKQEALSNTWSAKADEIIALLASGEK